VNATVGVQAYNIDLELFQEYGLGCDTTLELALGVRYAELWYDSAHPSYLTTSILSNFSGFGGTMGAELKRTVFRGDVYARARFSVLVGDPSVRVTNIFGDSFTNHAEDTVATQTELALGYEVRRYTNLGEVSLRGGVEWQHWANAAAAQQHFFGGDIMEDAGFAGFVVGFGLER
jgi:hypothetical protein